MAQTEAQKKAKKKYDSKTYKNVNIKMKLSNAEALDKYINNNDINSRNSYIINCINYCINNNINVFDNQDNNSSQGRNSNNNNSDNAQE